MTEQVAKKEIKIFGSMVHESVADIYGKLIEYAFREAISNSTLDRSVNLWISLGENQPEDLSPEEDGGLIERIASYDLFVADITPALVSGTKSYPCPGVLFELGFAVKELSWDRIVLLQNEHFGPIHGLPFSLKSRRVVNFRFDPEGPNAKQETAQLINEINAGILAEFQRGAAAPEGASPAEQSHGTVELAMEPAKQGNGTVELAMEPASAEDSQLIDLTIEPTPGPTALEFAYEAPLELDRSPALAHSGESGPMDLSSGSKPAPVVHEEVELIDLPRGSKPAPVVHEEVELIDLPRGGTPGPAVQEKVELIDLSIDSAPALVTHEDDEPADLSDDNAPLLFMPERVEPVISDAVSAPEAAGTDQSEPMDASDEVPAEPDGQDHPEPVDRAAEEAPRPASPSRAEPADLLTEEAPDPANAKLIELSNRSIQQALALTNYRMQAFSKQNSLVKKIRSRGYWALSFFPTPLPENKPEPSALGAIIQQATLKTAGENYPLYYSGEEPECQADRVQQDYEVGATKCSWRQFSDGMYISFISFPNDWISNPETWDFAYDDETEPSLIFYPSEALRELSRFIEFISRHSATTLGGEGSLYYVRASCVGLQGRPLVEDFPMFKYTKLMRAEEKIFDWNRRLPATALTEPKALTLRILKRVLSVFNYDPGPEVLSEAHDFLAEKSKPAQKPSSNKD